MKKKLSHIDEAGNPGMVNVGRKRSTDRRAHARAILWLGSEIMKHLREEEIRTKKGPVFQTAVLAGIMGAKKTSELIPLCHPLGLDDCTVEVRALDNERIRIDCTASVHARTGVEMEALTGASIAALTVYDMCKALSHDIRIQEVKLMEKTGGKKDFKRMEKS